LPPADGEPLGPPSAELSDVCNRVALIAFRLALVFLGLFVVLAFLAMRSLGLWQLGGPANPVADVLAKFAGASLVVAMTTNATSFVASLWGRLTGKTTSSILMYLTGVLVLASAACVVSMMPYF
jgi:hypothetical protein